MTTSRPDRDSLPYRDCVGVAVFNAHGNVFLGHRKPEGDPVRVRVEWTEGGTAKKVRLEALVLNRKANAPMTETNWIFTGSMMRDGIFAAQMDRSIIALYHDPAALVDNPLPEGGDDMVWFANSATIPPVGTPVNLIITSAK